MRTAFLISLIVTIFMTSLSFSEHSDGLQKSKSPEGKFLNRPQESNPNAKKKDKSFGCPRSLSPAEHSDYKQHQKPSDSKIGSPVGPVSENVDPAGPGDWCSEDPKSDFDPPKEMDVKKCWDDAADPEIQKMKTCLSKVISDTKGMRMKTRKWPSQEEMIACGCKPDGVDTETGLRGRKLFDCTTKTGEGFFVSPVAFSPGLGIMGMPSEKYRGCMFDVVMKGDMKLPRPYLGAGSDNCYACHRRSQPESYRSGTPCPDISITVATNPKEAPTDKKTKSFKDTLFSPFSP